MFQVRTHNTNSVLGLDCADISLALKIGKEHNTKIDIFKMDSVQHTEEGEFVLSWCPTDGVLCKGDDYAQSE